MTTRETLLSPTLSRNGNMYNMATGELASDPVYRCSIYNVMPGRTYLVSAKSGSDSNFPLCGFFTQAAGLIETCETEPDTAFTDKPVVTPDNSAIMVVNSASPQDIIVYSGTYTPDPDPDPDPDPTPDPEPVEVGDFYIDIKPSSTVENFIYKPQQKTLSGWGSSNLCHSFFAVSEGETYYASGVTQESGGFLLGGFYDSSDNWISSFGEQLSHAYSDLEVTAPTGAVKAVVNTSTYPTTYPRLRTKVPLPEKVEELDGRVSANRDKIDKGFYPDQMRVVLQNAARNPFAFAPFDKGYVSFVFDDLRRQQDSIASIFEEFSMPLCLAAIPSMLFLKGNGLSAARGNFTVGMTMKQVCDQVVANGGEIMAHNADVVTATNQYDYDFMYDYFVTTRKKLEASGYTVRGLIRAGGSGFILKSKESEKWAEAFYEYSDFGYSVNHSIERENINQPIATIKTIIDTAVANNQWIQFYGHDYNYGGGTTLTNEADLREILQYCVTAGITVVTYSYIFDNFSSSWLAENGRGSGVDALGLLEARVAALEAIVGGNSSGS